MRNSFGGLGGGFIGRKERELYLLCCRAFEGERESRKGEIRLRGMHPRGPTESPGDPSG